MDTKKVATITKELSTSKEQVKTAMVKYVKAYKELMKETSGNVNITLIREGLIDLLNESTK